MQVHTHLITPPVNWMTTTQVAEVLAHIIKVSVRVVIFRPRMNVIQPKKKKGPCMNVYQIAHFASIN